jgi:hypothetical protein
MRIDGTQFYRIQNDGLDEGPPLKGVEHVCGCHTFPSDPAT